MIADVVEPVPEFEDIAESEEIVFETPEPELEDVSLSFELSDLEAGNTAQDREASIVIDDAEVHQVVDSASAAAVHDESEIAAEFGMEDLAQDTHRPFIAPPTEATLDYELPDTLHVPMLVLPETSAEEIIVSEPNSDEPPTLSDVVAKGAPEAVSPDVEEVVEVVQAFEGVSPAQVALPPGRVQPTQERGEVARVDAELLDNLLNNAGEVSILRSRLEQQVSSLDFNLSELSRTVTRLKDQLRKLEIETEAQILHKHQDDSKGREDFDPLELDRYSTIQQFSRALAESVSDVDSIEGLLESMTREAQNLLLQQARVVTELQNGLMRTRMVPFSRHAQRLTRLVRQVATDTGKRVELNITGAGGELDRQVLERMLPPFEHMLRNSVVHGIETPPERLARGKSESGTINVNLRREGAEMVITLQDDGRGIDVNAVREKARAKGLIPGDRVLTDEEALQLILEPGFSTATNVTQHAGRGVGMDVVVTEIKKLGGALFTDSKPGEGVRFTIRLPFTLAISQSLLVRVGESEVYALPLPTVEGVVRLTREEVEAHLKHDAPSFDYGGQLYKFQYLGTFLDAGISVLPDGDVPVPVVLIKAGEHSTALVTDELIGNREIVVKSVGPQVSSIRGIAGATILGDGRVVIILDMGALVRSEWRARPDSDVAARGEDRRTFALVVDDSITVRRVTQRLLERHGMRVLTAKDGIDALEILEEHVPDVILLDIEMPRMDGYEFATQVRANPRLADLPIIMITSRVSDKHRARAIEIGVNDYLGKPYQENQLLDAIEPLVQARRRARTHDHQDASGVVNR
jgi:chemosensory pili system protein ChpA (sensor histidine kinase/response regulator)